ncbi:hypothetical protein E0Z10_g1537 [Xylaria hypoxylon]|uniref:Uncharacterized protein n=1 Tax=Xylaria hypoxylon TaxID=37992 RepID=A0A4Z0Z6H0_9PEZI|nr:hypothetical protein E0Z10_g1537 [Xylaria hypoxylon]
MPSVERNRRQSRGFDYGASVAGENVDFADDSNVESTVESPGSRDRALIDKLKDALRPGDTRRPLGNTTHDGRHGGIEEIMQPHHGDYDESAPHRGGGLLDELGQRARAPDEGGRRRSSILEQTRFGYGQAWQGGQKQEYGQGENKGGGLVESVKKTVEGGAE